jgi:hypothetical protein
VVADDGAWLLRRVDRGPILRGLWLPALAELQDGSNPEEEAVRLVPIELTSPPKPVGAVRHNITHRKIDVMPFLFEAVRFDLPADAWRWVDPVDPGVPTSSLLQKLVDALPD